MNLQTMPLSNEQIKKIVKERRNEKELQEGVDHQNRLKFHTETILKKHDLSPYFLDFKTWIGAPGHNEPELLASDKFARIIQLIKAPIQTIELTESIFSRLFRVFYSQDSFFNYRFTDDSLALDWADFRDADFWRTKGFEAMQTAIDSVWIAAVPAEQLTEFPEPSNKLINIENVIAIQNDHDNNCIYVIFRLGNRIFVYDDGFFRVFSANNDDIRELIAEVPHDLGFCPARMFWSEKLIAGNLINKESPITKELTDLDWLLLHQSSKRYMDLANAYPITVTYEMDNDVTDDDTTANEQRTSGKRPSGNKLTGAGSHIEAKMPRGSDDHDPMRSDPVKIISPPVDTLKWHVEEEMRLMDKIFRSVVGVEQEIKNDAAKNIPQIMGSFESQVSVLFRIKKNFEIIQKFADSTIAMLRYGDRFIGCEIDYGTNFFLKDVDDLQNELKSAKEAGASESIIEAIGENILNTRYRNDSQNRQRADIILQLDPLPNTNMKDAIEILKSGGIDKIDFIIKSKLISFVNRFERENIDIVKFSSLTNFNRKIEQINEEFVKYAEETGTIAPINNNEDEDITETSGDT